MLILVVETDNPPAANTVLGIINKLIINNILSNSSSFYLAPFIIIFLILT